jgi:hypothetical protein
MRDLRLAVESTAPRPRGAVVRLAPSWWRNALLISLLAHAVGAYVAARVPFSVDYAPPLPELPDFFWDVERVVPPPSPRLPAETPRADETPSEPVVVEAPVAPEVSEEPVEEAPPPRVATEVTPGVVPERVPEVTIDLPSRSEIEDARARAADEIIAERADGDSYLTFSIDDVAPPRPVEEPKPKYDIFNPGPGAARTSAGQVGQGRSRLGNKLRELCNAFGGFGVGFQGFHLFDACGGPDDEPSGLFPEVKPAYLDLLPECAESEPEQPELAAAAPFSTVKCRLVRAAPVERWAYPGQPRRAPP